jgi:hypothetical protein
MKAVDKLRKLFQQIDEAKNPSEIEVLGNAVNIILAENTQQPIEGIASFLLERGTVLKQKLILI